MDFLHIVVYSDATNALWNHEFNKNIYELRLPTWIKIFFEKWNSINMHQSYSNGLLSEYMDYNLGSTLTFKCIFCYDFISIFLISTQYIKNHWNKNMYWKTLQKKN
jgi:hypothetical protein